MSEGVTPGDEAKKPVEPATPPAPEVKPGEETVTLTKAEADQLRRDAARASSAQSRADRLARLAGRSSGRFGASAAPAPAAPSKDEQEANLIEEDRKAERGLTALVIDPKYREVLDTDPTLRNMLTKNPLGVLPVMAADALDAEDAISLVREKLDERLAALSKPKNDAADQKKPDVPAAPPAGGQNVPDKSVQDEIELARKNPNTEQAIAGMIRVGAKHMKK